MQEPYVYLPHSDTILRTSRGQELEGCPYHQGQVPEGGNVWLISAPLVCLPWRHSQRRVDREGGGEAVDCPGEAGLACSNKSRSMKQE